MTRQTELLDGLDQVGVVARAMDIVAAEAGDTSRIHDTLHKVVALHPILMPCAIRKMGESRVAELMFLELPEVLQIESLTEADSPVVVLPGDWILQRSALG